MLILNLPYSARSDSDDGRKHHRHQHRSLDGRDRLLGRCRGKNFTGSQLFDALPMLPELLRNKIRFQKISVTGQGDQNRRLVRPGSPWGQT